MQLFDNQSTKQHGAVAASKACAAALVVLSMSIEAQAQQLSAVDAFRLRGECHQLGQKLVAGMDDLGPFASLVINIWDRYTDINYNATDNRCYVLIRQSQNAQGEKLGYKCTTTTFMDVQTSEALAWTEDGPACQRGENGTLKASHFGVIIGGNVFADFDETHDFIKGKMGR